MVRVRVEQELPHPVESVFDAASDPQKQLQWDAGMLRSVQPITPGPLGKGSRYRGNFKQMGVVEYEYAQFDRPRRFEHRAQTKMGPSWHVFTFEPAAHGTKMTQGRHRTEGRVATRLADDVDDVRLEVPQDRESAGRLPVDVERIDAVRLNPGVGTIPRNASGSEGGLRREAHDGPDRRA